MRRWKLNTSSKHEAENFEILACASIHSRINGVVLKQPLEVFLETCKKSMMELSLKNG